VTGKEVIAELVVELRASVEAAEQFEGEMRNLAAYAKALAQALDCIRSAGGNRSVTFLQPLTSPCSLACYHARLHNLLRCLSPGIALHPLRW
jgi:hypothetical protein